MFFILYGIQLMGEFIPFGLFRLFIPQLCLFFLIIFVKYTFYKDNKSKVPTLQILIFIFLKILEIIYVLIYDFQIPLKKTISISLIPLFYSYITILALEISIPLFWLGYKALVMYNKLKVHDIQPWLKKRYLLISISSFFLGLSSYANYLLPYEGGYEEVNPIIFMLIASALLVFSFGNLIAWVMPKSLKRHFNRKYKTNEDLVLTERDITDIFKEKLSGGN